MDRAPRECDTLKSQSEDMEGRQRHIRRTEECTETKRKSLKGLRLERRYLLGEPGETENTWGENRADRDGRV